MSTVQATTTDRDQLREWLDVTPAAMSLWQGDFRGCSSIEAADLSLCRYLASIADGDPVQIDRLFRCSGLMRPKWDDQSYGANVVRLALMQEVEAA